MKLSTDLTTTNILVVLKKRKSHLLLYQLTYGLSYTSCFVSSRMGWTVKYLKSWKRILLVLISYCITQDWIIEKHHLILNWIFPVHGVEYSFGAHDYPSSGVFEVEPRECPGFRFRRSIFIGTTDMDPIQVREFMERQSAYYRGDTYHLVMKNCNHFSEDMCYRLTGNRIPKWVNRLARIGSLIFYYYLFCMLPNDLLCWLNSLW